MPDIGINEEQYLNRGWTISVLAIITSILWYPWALIRINLLGFDFPIYYYAAKEGINSERVTEVAQGWHYNNIIPYLFKPLTIFSLDVAFLIWYVILIFCWVIIIRFLVRRGLYGNILALVSFYPMLLNLELGQITPVLGALCLTPLGCVLAILIKPFCAILLIPYFIGWYRDRRNRVIMEKS